MKFRCEITMDNAAFDDAPASELANMLRRIAREIERGHTERAAIDCNGNTAGHWAVEGNRP